MGKHVGYLPTPLRCNLKSDAKTEKQAKEGTQDKLLWNLENPQDQVFNCDLFLCLAVWTVWSVIWLAHPFVGNSFSRRPSSRNHAPALTSHSWHFCSPLKDFTNCGTLKEFMHADLPAGGSTHCYVLGNISHSFKPTRSQSLKKVYKSSHFQYHGQRHILLSSCLLVLEINVGGRLQLNRRTHCLKIQTQYMWNITI